jgi:hypothetical protein
MAYINTSGRPSRRERSERRDSDVHGAGVLRYGGILGIPYNYIWNLYMYARNLYSSYGIRMRRVLGVFLYIYLIDVNLDYLSE